MVRRGGRERERLWLGEGEGYVRVRRGEGEGEGRVRRGEGKVVVRRG